MPHTYIRFLSAREGYRAHIIAFRVCWITAVHINSLFVCAGSPPCTYNCFLSALDSFLFYISFQYSFYNALLQKILTYHSYSDKQGLKKLNEKTKSLNFSNFNHFRGCFFSKNKDKKSSNKSRYYTKE